MEKQSVIIYFNGNTKSELVFGNFPDSVNEIDDYNMSILDGWTKRPSGICEFENMKGIKYRIYPSNINYVEVHKQ